MRKYILLFVVLFSITTHSVVKGTNPNTYLNFTALSDTATVGLHKYGNPYYISLKYSIDSCVTWVDYTMNQDIQLLRESTVFFKPSGGSNYHFSMDFSNYYKFAMTGSIAADGNIISLIESNMIQSASDSYCYCYLFENCTSLTQAPALPATSVSQYGYCGMFYGCTSLTQAPALPATSVSQCGYKSMFYGCTSLTQAPELPATAIGNHCYETMFKGCTSLNAAPALPATTLGDYCYQSMFEGCTSLMQASTILATDLADGCCSGMFYGCTSLTQGPPSLPATMLNHHCYCAMFYGCTSLTQAPTLPVVTLAPRYCCAGMFKGCTSLTQSPSLTATSLLSCCYSMMFEDCTSLTQAPALPATGLADQCYQDMFKGCTSLTQAPALPAASLTNQCYQSMFEGCTSLTQAPALPAASLANQCYQDMFKGCTSLTQAPALPTVSLANQCYHDMFKGCTSLTQAPALPAVSLANQCYQSMFEGCTSLTQAPALPAATLASYCYSVMFKDCISLTMPPVLPAVTLSDYCYYSMFKGCTSLILNTARPGTQWVIPATTIGYNSLSAMFDDTGGTMKGTPSANTIYYIPIGCPSVTVNLNDSTMGGVIGGGWYIRGDTVTLMAFPNANCHFVNWSNGKTSSTINIHLLGDSTLTANFAYNLPNQYSVTVNVNDPEFGSVTGDGIYNQGDTVILTAVPKPGNHFVIWSNGKTTPTVSFQVQRNSALMACFATNSPNQHSATVYVNNPIFGSVVGNGVYNHGDTATLIAKPNAHCSFVSWSNGATTPTIKVLMDKDTVITAVFAFTNTYTVSAIANDDDMGVVSGGGTYSYGDTVTITATAFDHYHFAGWNDGRTTSTITIVVTDDVSLVALFEANTYNVVATANNSNMGTVTGGGEYDYGSRVTVTATPNEGYEFSGWSNGETSNVITFVIENDTAFIAIFTPITGVEETSRVEYVAYTQGLTIILHGAADRSVRIFDMTGKLVKLLEKADDECSFDMQVAGVYVIKVGDDDTISVVVK